MTDRGQAGRVLKMLMERYPQQRAALPDIPGPDEVLVCDVKPTVISLLDYSEGFAHTELVHVQERSASGRQASSVLPTARHICRSLSPKSRLSASGQFHQLEGSALAIELGRFRTC